MTQPVNIPAMGPIIIIIITQATLPLPIIIIIIVMEELQHHYLGLLQTMILIMVLEHINTPLSQSWPNTRTTVHQTA